MLNALLVARCRCLRLLQDFSPADRRLVFTHVHTCCCWFKSCFRVRLRWILQRRVQEKTKAIEAARAEEISNYHQEVMQPRHWFRQRGLRLFFLQSVEASPCSFNLADAHSLGPEMSVRSQGSQRFWARRMRLRKALSFLQPLWTAVVLLLFVPLLEAPSRYDDAPSHGHPFLCVQVVRDTCVENVSTVKLKGGGLGSRMDSVVKRHAQHCSCTTHIVRWKSTAGRWGGGTGAHANIHIDLLVRFHVSADPITTTENLVRGPVQHSASEALICPPLHFRRRAIRSHQQTKRFAQLGRRRRAVRGPAAGG